MTLRDVEKIPERMKDRPRYRGLPIPYTAYCVNGEPDFRTVNAQRIADCMENRKCGLCGQRLGLKMYFFGGELCNKNRMFLDPPMHRECIDFAVKVCPYISLSSKEYNMRKPFRENVEINPHVSTAKGRQAIFTSSGYRLYNHEGSIYFHSNVFIKVEWLDQPEAQCPYSGVSGAGVG